MLDVCVCMESGLYREGGLRGRLDMVCGGEWVARKPELNILLSALIPTRYQYLYICPSLLLTVTHTQMHTHHCLLLLLIFNIILPHYYFSTPCSHKYRPLVEDSIPLFSFPCSI